MDEIKLKHVDIYTDGACRGNPGVGGWGAVLVYRGREKGRTCDVDGCPVVSATLGRQEMLRYRRAFPVLDRIDEFNIGL